MIDEVRRLLGDAVVAYGGSSEADVLHEARERLDGPLRVAFAGRSKAGKSTLLNALVGEALAATDATECTRIVTWYENGPAARVWAQPLAGPPVPLRFRRDAGSTSIDLGGLTPDSVHRLVVETPSSRLQRLTLVDTPGLGSATAGVSARTRQFLLDDDGSGADAVLYLMRHVHGTDVGFLQAFGDATAAAGQGVNPVTTVGVLSRADELAGGRPDGMVVAERIAARYRVDPDVRALVQTVVPVSGLLGQAAVGVREVDHAAVVTLAAGSDSVLLSADRLVAAARGDQGSPVPAEVRADLLNRFGLFGVRLAVALVRAGSAADAGELSRRLHAESGLDQVRAVLLERFVGRAELLKAQRALGVVAAVIERSPGSGVDILRERLGAIVAGAHELAELRLLADLRAGTVELADGDLLAEAEAILGVHGRDLRTRLGLQPEADDAQVRGAAVAGVRRWQRRAENPVADPDLRRAAAVLRRSCEGAVARLQE